LKGRGQDQPQKKDLEFIAKAMQKEDRKKRKKGVRGAHKSTQEPRHREGEGKARRVNGCSESKKETPGQTGSVKAGTFKD